MRILILKQDNLRLSCVEAIRLLKPKYYRTFGRLMISDHKYEEYEERLAGTEKILDLLFWCNNENLVKRFRNFNWSNVCKGTFAVRARGKSVLDKELAKEVWRTLRNPKVNLDNPNTLIEVFFEGRKSFVGIYKKNINHEFAKRKAHLRPFHKPVSLDPRTARIMVNLSGIRKGTVFDPFCGTGGILIEAGLMGLNSVGYDISKEMIDGSKKNLEHYLIKNYCLSEKDSTKLKKKMDYVVTDLPYMKNTKGNESGLNDLYTSFFKMLERSLQDTAVIGMPDTTKRIILPSGLKKTFEGKIYLHRSLSKKIIIVKFTKRI